MSSSNFSANFFRFDVLCFTACGVEDAKAAYDWFDDSSIRAFTVLRRSPVKRRKSDGSLNVTLTILFLIPLRVLFTQGVAGLTKLLS